MGPPPSRGDITLGRKDMSKVRAKWCADRSSEEQGAKAWRLFHMAWAGRFSMVRCVTKLVAAARAQGSAALGQLPQLFAHQAHDQAV